MNALSYDLCFPIALPWTKNVLQFSLFSNNQIKRRQINDQIYEQLYLSAIRIFFLLPIPAVVSAC